MKRVLERNKPKREILENFVKSFFVKNPNCERAVVQIKEDKLTRSQKQNNLYWMWLGLIEKETGQPAEDYFDQGKWKKGLHYQFRRDYLPRQFYDDGEIKIPSSKDLNTTQFKDYLERIDMEMAQMGITLPRPDDLYYAAMGIKT